jgi:hypothetical protein
MDFDDDSDVHLSDVDSDEDDDESEFDECEDLTEDEENVEWCNSDRTKDARLKILIMFLSKKLKWGMQTCTRKKYIKKTVEERLRPWIFIETWTDNISNDNSA